MPVELPAGVQVAAAVNAAVTSLTVAAGEPGIDTATAGVLEIGGDNATTVEIGKGNVVVDASGNVAARSYTASSSSPNAAYGGGIAGTIGGLNFYPAATDAGIRAAAVAANAAGGGWVHINPPSPWATIPLVSPLPVLNGVKYIGVEPILTPKVPTVGSYGSGFEWDYAGGTVLVGDGTFSAFEQNATDQAGAQSNLGVTEIDNVAIENIGFDNFTYGLRIGAQSIMGLIWSKLHKLYFRNCSQWGVYMVNFSMLDVRDIRSCLCQNGQYWADKVNGSAALNGNSTLTELYNLLPRDGRDNRLCRGIVFECSGYLGGAAGMPEMEVDRLQANGYNRSLLSVTATFTSGVAAFAVPDGTKFLAGMLVNFTGAAAGFVANQMYVVQSVVSNTITLGNSRTGAVITPNASTTLTLQTYGFPNIEITSANTGAKVSYSKFTHIDSEGTASVGLYIENAVGCYFELTSTPLSGVLCDVVGRNCGFSKIQSLIAIIYDLDAASNTTEVSGYLGAQPVQVRARGLTFDGSTTTYGLQIAPGGKPTVGALQTNITAISYLGTNHAGVISITTGGTGPVDGNMVALMTMSPGWDKTPVIVIGTYDNGRAWVPESISGTAFNIRYRGVAALATGTVYKIPVIIMPGSG